MLQRVSDGKGTQGTSKGPVVIFYFASVIVAFLMGAHFEKGKAPLPSESSVALTIPAQDQSTPAPAPSVAAAIPATPAPVASATPALISMTSTPAHIERAIPVSSQPSTGATAKPAASQPPVVAENTATVTVLKPLEIPVKQSGKIVGYINLQAGQKITPAGVEQGQIKVKTGENYVYVPVTATDMPH